MNNESRLKALRIAIDDEAPVDGIHSDAVRELYENGGECPRYLGCTSEGSEESTYRDNPDFFAGDLEEMGQWLALSYGEGWAANWVCDLDDPKAPSCRSRLDWKVFVQVPGESRTPFVLSTLALLGAANDVLVERRNSVALPELVEVVAEVVNRSLGRAPEEVERTKVLIGAKRPRSPAG